MGDLPSQKAQSTKPTPIKSVSTNKPLDSQVEKVVDSVTVNIFFDGTKNNLYNTDTYGRKSEKDQQYYERKGKYESYTNAYSNVAHLYQGRSTTSKDIWVYVEGIGTLKDKTDDQDGFAYGRGGYGIPSRVNDGLVQIFKAVQKEYGSTAKILKFKINVFGFSRGAAAARHFIYRINTSKHAIGWQYRTSITQIYFVGIFDTVSSYDPSSIIFTDFKNDVEELHIDFKAGYAKKVFHLCALDEYRIFFSLTNIQSARRLGFGYEVYLPGAHADIGGSYSDAKPNSYPVTNDPLLKNWFYQQGFFKPSNLEIDQPVNNPRVNTHTPTPYIPKENLVRPSLSNAYYKVPLKTMKLMAEKEAKIGFDLDYFKDKNQGSGVINQLLAQIPSAVIKRIHWDGGAENYSHLYQNLPNFRYQYIHWSARYELGYHLRRGKGNGNDTIAVAQSERFTDHNELPFRKIWPG